MNKSVLLLFPLVFISIISNAKKVTVRDEIIRNASYLEKMPLANQKLYLSGNTSGLSSEEKTALLYLTFTKIERFETWESVCDYYHLEREHLKSAFKASDTPILFGRLKLEDRENLFCYQTEFMGRHGYAAYFLFADEVDTKRPISKIVWHWGESLKEDLLCGGRTSRESDSDKGPHVQGDRGQGGAGQALRLEFKGDTPPAAAEPPTSKR